MMPGAKLGIVRTHDLTGDWAGFYVEPGNIRAVSSAEDDPHRFGIRVRLRQEGASFKGEMQDDVTENENTYAQILEHGADAFTEVEQRQIQDMLLIEPNIKVRSVLPENSTIVGSMKGSNVQFTKTYVGAHTVEIVIGGRRKCVLDDSSHRVMYLGVISVDGESIEGTWLVRQAGLLGRLSKPSNQGTFKLMRSLR